jgi:hypothetical protein
VKLRMLLMAAVALGFALVQATVDGGDKKKDEPFPVPKPGPEHKLIAKLSGTWDGKIKAWFNPGEPMESTAVTTRKMIMDGLYMQENHTGTFAGMKFKGLGLLGYDTAKKKYVQAFIDNFGTGISQNEGTYDESKKAWTFLGEEDSPIFGKMKTRDVLTVVSEDSQHFEMYRTPGKDGKEMKVMEITYTRKPVEKKKAG